MRLGTMLTPLPRRKPWELAGQVATVDRLSNGRVIVSVGLGAPDSGYEAFGEETDKVVRGRTARRGLGHPARTVGRAAVQLTTASTTRSHRATFPTIGHTTQQPGVPIWCVGALGSNKSMSRALSCDGLIPQVVEDGNARQCTLEELQHVRDPRSSIRCGRRRRMERALACGMGRGRRNVVAGDVVERGQ